MEPSLPYYYQILNINMDATQDSIQEAYSEAREAFHQDSLANYGLLKQEEIRKTLEEIELAYNILSNPQKKIQYDKEHAPNRNPKIKIHKATTPKPKLKATKKINSSTEQHFAISDYDAEPEMEGKIEQATQIDGAFLKEVREYRNISLEQIENITRISTRNLQLLEEDNKAALPCITYIRGFIKQYAKVLQLDADKVAEYYIKNLEEKGTW